MARTVSTRVTVTGQLQAETPLHVGGHGDSPDADLPLACNGSGQWYVPGTSLSGTFRAWCERAFGESLTRSVWGYQEGEEGLASHVHVEDAAILNPDAAMAELRDGVGIDRQWGCAAEEIKYERLVLPRGTRLGLELTFEFDEPDRAQILTICASLARTLSAGELRVGAAQTRGLGKLRLLDAEVHEHALNDHAGILSLLRGEKGRAVEWRDAPLKTAPRLEISLRWRPVGPLMVKAGRDGIGVDSIPLVSAVGGQAALSLPGSSVKGAIRNQAERIVRTLSGMPLTQVEDPKQRFLTHLAELPLIQEVFGAAGVRRRGDQAPEGKSRPGTTQANVAGRGRGALGVDDCYGRLRFSPEQWLEITSAASEARAGQRNSPLRTALDAAGLGAWTPAFHVAIDRWTGGAAESLLYTVLEPLHADWEDVCLTLDLDRLQKTGTDPLVALMLVLLVVRDMARGRVPLGFATHRGMGSIAIENVLFRGFHLPDCLSELAQLDLGGADLTRLPDAFKRSLEQAWRLWRGGSLEQDVREETA